MHGDERDRDRRPAHRVSCRSVRARRRRGARAAGRGGRRRLRAARAVCSTSEMRKPTTTAPATTAVSGRSQARRPEAAVRRLRGHLRPRTATRARRLMSCSESPAAIRVRMNAFIAPRRVRSTGRGRLAYRADELDLEVGGVRRTRQRRRPPEQGREQDDTCEAASRRQRVVDGRLQPNALVLAVHRTRRTRRQRALRGR